MLFCAVFDTRDLAYTDVRPLLSLTEQARLDQKKNESYRAASAIGRLLAGALYEHAYARTAPPIITGEHGAPSFLGESVSLSISHSDRLVGVAISDDGCVGIDVESCAFMRTHSIAHIDALRSKFNIPSITYASELADCLTASFDGSAFSFSCIHPCEPLSDSPDFLRDYTALEAVMKADGRGFLAIAQAPSLAKSAFFRGAVLRDQSNEKYVISIAYFDKM